MAATVAAYCPSRVVEHPKSKSTQPKFASSRRWATLYIRKWTINPMSKGGTMRGGSGASRAAECRTGLRLAAVHRIQDEKRVKVERQWWIHRRPLPNLRGSGMVVSRSLFNERSLMLGTIASEYQLVEKRHLAAESLFIILFGSIGIDGMVEKSLDNGIYHTLV